MSNRKLGNSFESERWVAITGYEGLYSISDLGRVMSHHWGANRIRQLRTDLRGYTSVTLCKNSVLRTYKVHRLVAIHFLPNPYLLREVNHKDENKENNHLDNLEWCTRGYNVNYGSRTEKQRRHLSKRVIQLADGCEVARYDSITDAARSVGATVSQICACCKKKRHSAHGFAWEYAIELGDDDD